MKKPVKLIKGDKVATISLSWGGAGDIPHRYKAGKSQLQEKFGLQVVETKNALRSSQWLYNNPKARAEDLMEALEDKSIKAIISNIGGEDNIRILPYINQKIIAENPKIFIGFSDSTVTHFCFYKAGVTSFYGTSTLVGFAENGGMHQYQINDIKKTLFTTEPRGIINPNTEGWTSEMLDWNIPANQQIKRKLKKTNNWYFLQGKGKVKGELLGGCLEVLEFLKDTPYWVSPIEWKDKLMFIETSEMKLKPENFGWILRNYAASGILHNINGLIFARPYDNCYYEEYEKILLKVINKEEGLTELPIITRMDFGHTCPTFTIPYGVKAEINFEKRTFSILENGVKNQDCL